MRVMLDDRSWSPRTLACAKNLAKLGFVLFHTSTHWIIIGYGETHRRKTLDAVASWIRGERKRQQASERVG